MTEKEKAAAGYLYNANYDKVILTDMGRCKDLCHAFNQTRPSDRDAQYKILRQILGTMGKQITVNAPFWCDYGYNISVGNFFSQIIIVRYSMVAGFNLETMFLLLLIVCSQRQNMH